MMSRVTWVSFTAGEQSYLDFIAGDEQSHLLFLLLVSRVTWISVASDEQSHLGFFYCW